MTIATPLIGQFDRDRPATNKWVVTMTVLVGTMASSISGSSVNVALTHIMASFGVNTQEVTWVSTSYLTALVIVMPLTAWVSSVLGRKRMYLLALLIFTLASAGCGLSQTLGELILFRVVAGLGGGAMLPTSQAIMRETFPLEEQGQAMGIFGVIAFLGPAIGPTLGGWLTDNYTWHWIFFVNLPIGPIGLLLAARFLHDPPYMRGRGLQRVDGVGIGLLAIGLTALQIMLEEGEPDGWFQSAFINLATATAVLTLTAFVLWELRIPAPAVNLRILGNLSFAAGTFIGGVFGMAMFATMLVLPLFLQNLLGYDATQAGLALVPRALAMVVMMYVSGQLYNRLGVFVMVPFGLVLTAIAGFMMGRFTLYSGPVQIQIPQVIQGIGFSFLSVPLATAALARIPRPLMQSATGLFNLVRMLGGSVGVAAAITILDHKTTSASTHLMQYAAVGNSNFTHWWSTYQAAFVARGSDPWTAHRQALAVLQGLVNQQAAVVAYDYVFAIVGATFLVCIPLVSMMRSGPSSVATGAAATDTPNPATRS